jgi:hypothetical protein
MPEPTRDDDLVMISRADLARLLDALDAARQRASASEAKPDTGSEER